MLIGDNAGSAQMVMAAQPALQRTVVLHIGMHKTASTYIQKRLRKNRALLKANGLLMPKRRDLDTALLHAADQGHWKPWRQWLERAESRGCDTLISHEAFSQTLRKPASRGSQARGLWLAERLRKRGWRLKLICFVRDQESYLNSRYTQLVKRLSIRSDFPPYVDKVMKGNTISECDLITLFGWLRQQPDIDVVMVPFGSTRDQHGRRLETRPDPFHQLVAALALPPAVITRCKPARSLNQQPGRLGVSLALAVSRFLAEHHPEALKLHAKQLRGAIERMAKANDWPSEPFNGLNIAIRERIRHRYQASNAEFCRTFWRDIQINILFLSDPSNRITQGNTVAPVIGNVRTCAVQSSA